MTFLPSNQENVLQNLQYAAKLASEKCGLCPKLLRVMARRQMRTKKKGKGLQLG